MKTIYFTMLLSLTAIAPGNVFACDAAGENTHVGQVLSTQGNQFTIRDAQSGGPINFTADATMKGALPAVGDQVAVKYSKDKNGLKAESVR